MKKNEFSIGQEVYFLHRNNDEPVFYLKKGVIINFYLEQDVVNRTIVEVVYEIQVNDKKKLVREKFVSLDKEMLKNKVLIDSTITL